MENRSQFIFCFIAVVFIFFALTLFPSRAGAEVSSGDFQVLKKSIEILQKQIEVQGQEIASLKNQLGEKSERGTVYLSPKEGPSLAERAGNILLSQKEPLTPEEKQLITLYDDGFWLKGKDDTIRVGGWYQADLDIYDRRNPGNTRFRNRRARLDVRGVLENYFGYRLYGDFAGGSASLQEAWLEYKQFPSARFRVGQFVVPFSLDANTSARWIDFVERPVGVANLQPAEDLGAMIFGAPFGGRVDYAFGAFNGRSRLSEDNNDAFDLAGRLVLAPFRKSSHDLLKDLYLGSSFTTGREQETLGGTSFTTAGGTSFFTYGSGVRHADDRTRLGGELQWIYGPGDIKAEYVGASFNEVDLNGNKSDVKVNSWYVSGTYVLTGERKQRDRPLHPKKSFDPIGGGWGAWEVAARYEEFLVNNSPLTQGFATGTDRVDSFSVGLNWWPNVHTRLMVDYVLNHFADEVTARGETLDGENLVLVRTQYDF